jgi:hypothetical protein
MSIAMNPEALTAAQKSRQMTLVGVERSMYEYCVSKGPPNCCTRLKKTKQQTEGARASTTSLADLVRMGFCLQTKQTQHSSGG